jgi:hypothetical protein
MIANANANSVSRVNLLQDLKSYVTCRAIRIHEIDKFDHMLCPAVV